MHVSNYTAVIINDTKTGKTVLNMTGKILNDIQKLLFYFELKAKSDPDKLEYDRLVLKGEIDSCKSSKGVVGNFIANFIVGKISKFSNYRFACPQPKIFLIVNNFPLPSDKDIPAFLISVKGKFSLLGRLKGKISMKKVSFQMASLEIFGKIV